jgi:hypothetical protein
VSERKSYPLSWPEGWKRTTSRKFGQFRTGNRWISVNDATRRVLNEFRHMQISADDIIVSTNVPLRLDGMPRSDQEPADPGVAIYWQTKKHGMRCIATDRYQHVADNLAAIAATLEAMRAIERHGGAQIIERAFLGFAALPETATQPWREVLGIAPEITPTPDLVQSRYRALVKLHHPDITGDKESEDFQRIVQARDAALMEMAS